MPDQAAEVDPSEVERAARTVGLLAGDRRISLLLGIGIVMLLVAIAAAALAMIQIAEDTDLVEHTLVVEASANRVAAFNERVETGRRGYIIDGSASFQRTVSNASSEFKNELTKLQGLVSDNPQQERRVEEIVALNAEREELLATLFAQRGSVAEINAGAFDTERGVAIVRRIRAIAAEMIEHESRLLSERNQSQLNSLILLYLVGGVALALLIGVLGTIIYTALRYNRTLGTAQTLLQQANEGLEAAVGRRTAELQRANNEIQRFAYIVSHDLRSPLVNVLGFTAELDEARKTIRAFLAQVFERHPALRDETAWLAVDEDLPEALGFIRTSTEKMDRLINSILQLSRQGRRLLSPEPLDLDAVVAGIIADLHQRAADSGATISAAPLPNLVSDRLAVEQILSNLIENAIKYASPGRPGEVRVEGRQQGRTVEIDVIDNGRGIAPEDHERIFELFRRSGTQDTAGEGIGLAHVRALAYRLGGTVDVQSQLDQGARFRLSLPARFIPTEQADE